MFTFNDLDLSVKKIGTRTAVFTEPEINTTPVFNSFSMNPLLSDILRVKRGDNIVILTAKYGENIVFLVTKGGFTYNDEVLSGAKLVSPTKSDTGSFGFNYSGLYLTVLGGGKKEGVSIDELIKAGRLVEWKTPSVATYKATKKVYLKIVENGILEDGSVLADKDGNSYGIPEGQPVVALVYSREVDHDASQEVEEEVEVGEVATEESTDEVTDVPSRKRSRE